MDLTRLSPPVNTAALNDDGLHAPLWQAHHQDLVDALQQIALTMHKGSVDGSDAQPGEVGEYLTASAGPVSLVTGTLVNVVSLALTAGDWDVSGGATFVTGSGTLNAFGAGIGGGTDIFVNATFPAGATNQRAPTSAHRYNVTAPTTVWLNAQAFFSGTVTAQGDIRARRMR